MDKRLIKQNQEKWNNSIAELEKYFQSIILPNKPFKLNDYSTITNCTQFVENHLAVVRENSGKQTFLPYLHRLQELKEFLKNTKT